MEIDPKLKKDLENLDLKKAFIWIFIIMFLGFVFYLIDPCGDLCSKIY